MTIVHILYFTEFAGTEKVCVDLCNEMSKENEVYLLCNKNGFNGEIITDYLDEKVKFINIPTNKNRYNPLYLYQLAKIIKKIKPAVIHTHNTKFLEISKYLQIFLLGKIPLVFTKHNWFAKKKMKLADLCIGISPKTLALCQDANGGGEKCIDRKWHRI